MYYSSGNYEAVLSSQEAGRRGQVRVSSALGLAALTDRGLLPSCVTAR